LPAVLKQPLSSDGSDVLVKYTINGDFNLDGTVNSSDKSILLSNENGSAGNDFLDGDATGDGIVSSADLSIYNQFKYVSLPNSPAAPSGFTAALDPASPLTQIDFSWQAPATQPDHYVLEQSTNSTHFTDLPEALAGNLTSYDLAGLSSSTQYWFRLRAVYSSGTPSVAVVAMAIVGLVSHIPRTIPIHAMPMAPAISRRPVPASPFCLPPSEFCLSSGPTTAAPRSGLPVMSRSATARMSSDIV
jgi:hypothetical protein